MSKRKFEEDCEDCLVETKRHKTEQDDTRKASIRVLMNRNIIGSVLAPFLITADLNSLMRACKTLVAHLNTNPEAWSPVLFINKAEDLPLFYKQDQKQKNILSKISPTKLRKMVIDITNVQSEHMDNLYVWSTVLAVVLKQRPLDELVLIDFHNVTDLRISRWHLYAKVMSLKNVTIGRFEDSIGGSVLPSVVEEWTCTLQTVHCHAKVLNENRHIRRLNLDASFADKDNEDCSRCEEAPSAVCFPYHYHGIETLEVQLGRFADGETKSDHWELRMATSSMPNLKQLILSGKTDRPQAWLTEDITYIRRNHHNGAHMQIDVSNLQVPKVVVVPEHVPFVLPSPL